MVSEPYSQVNSRGVAYFLHSKEVTLRGNRLSRIYYFAKVSTPEFVCSLPEDRVVVENSKTGLLFLKKKV
jgi:hypothetical protein